MAYSSTAERPLFETDNGRSALAAGTGLHAPKPTPIITLADGEVGWIADLHQSRDERLGRAGNRSLGRRWLTTQINPRRSFLPRLVAFLADGELSFVPRSSVRPGVPKG
jgi:hypothetical protein